MTLSTLSPTYNGWTNYETWNVALYIQNEFALYKLALTCETYGDFVAQMQEWGDFITPDGVSWTHPTLNTDELDEMIQDLRA